MPTKLEIFDVKTSTWNLVAKRHPGNPPGTLSDNSGNKRELYLFECASDDTFTTTYRSPGGVDVAEGINRTVYPVPSELEIVTRLSRGESHEMTVMTDRSSVAHKIKITHE